MSNVIVLGAGMVGKAMAVDMAHKHRVTIADINPEQLENAKNKHHQLNTKLMDVTGPEDIESILQCFDLVISAVPGYLGFETLRRIIQSGRDVVDISFMPENALELNSLAKDKNVTAIFDCGVAPGLDNLILGYHNEKLHITHFECLVGGLPKEKKWPFYYKAPFSPFDVIEEYKRPARYVENGRYILKEALTDCEIIVFDKVGELESFNSDGLRSIIHTMTHIPNLKEKTLRYPGHVEYIKVLKETGFFSSEPIKVGHQSVSPLAFTSSILFKEWELHETDEEFTVMRITIQGKNEENCTVKIVYNLYDEFDRNTQTSSMARTTGYTATGAANLILKGFFNEKGIIPPEMVGKHEDCFQYILEYLNNRKISPEVNTQFSI